MTTITVHTHVGPDGKLRLEIPSGLPEGPVEAVIVINPTASDLKPQDVRTGVLDGANLDIDVEADLKEATEQWQQKLKDL